MVNAIHSNTLRAEAMTAHNCFVAAPRTWKEVLEHFAGQSYPGLYRAFGELRPKLGCMADQPPFYPYTFADSDFVYGRTMRNYAPCAVLVCKDRRVGERSGEAKRWTGVSTQKSLSLKTENV